MENLRLNFGKHKGQYLSNTPKGYQNWLNSQDWFKDYVKKCNTILAQFPKGLTTAIYSLEKRYENEGIKYAFVSAFNLKSLNLINKHYDDFISNWDLKIETTTQEQWKDMYWEILDDENNRMRDTEMYNHWYGVDGWTKK